MKHLKSSMVACVVAVVSLVPSVAAAQAKNPRIGVWKLDVAKSTYDQGTKPASETRSFLATDDGGIQMTGEAVSPTGTKQPTGYRAKYDGKDYPYTSAAGDTIAMSGDGWNSTSTIKMGGKVMQTSHGVVSKDGTTLTIVTKTAAGNAVSTRVYVKQPTKK